MQIREQLLHNEALIGSYVYERTAVIRMAYVALLTREHVLWLGPPGTAKSLLARLMAKQFVNAVYREYLFSRQSTEADVFAHKSIPDFMEGREVWLLNGHLSEGHIVFADEIFKSSGSTLNCGLSFLNERLVKGQPVPLITCFAASNELGGDEGLEALRDRFVISHVFNPLADAETRALFARDRIAGRQVPELTPITLHDLWAAQEEVAALPLEDATIDAVLRIQKNLCDSGCFVSDRTVGKCFSILRAFAWLDRDSAAGIEHLQCLNHVLWNEPAQIASVDAAINTIDKGVLGDVRNIIERALADYRNFRKSVLPDGSWSDTKAKERYRYHLEDLRHRCQTASQTISSKYGGRLSNDIRGRVQRYVDVLKEAYDQMGRDLEIPLPVDAGSL